MAGNLVDFTFTDQEPEFHNLITTQQPQPIAAVVQNPSWEIDQVVAANSILLLDTVQDPGNVGAIFRLALGFNATIILVESADPTNSKTIRSSAGAMFSVPWVNLTPPEAMALPDTLPHTRFRLEKRDHSSSIPSWTSPKQALLVIGSEGSGISLDITGSSIMVEHAGLN